VTNVPGNAELTPDLDLTARVVGCIVDMGAFEVAAGSGPVCGCGDTNGDGTVDVNDLNNVILDWGTDGSAHGGDLTDNTLTGPPDGIVNVNDMVSVIMNWGDCETALELPASVQACIAKLGHDPVAVLSCIIAAGYFDE
jgi:hypothetical protein